MKNKRSIALLIALSISVMSMAQVETTKQVFKETIKASFDTLEVGPFCSLILESGDENYIEIETEEVPSAPILQYSSNKITVQLQNKEQGIAMKIVTKNPCQNLILKPSSDVIWRGKKTPLTYCNILLENYASLKVEDGLEAENIDVDLLSHAKIVIDQIEASDLLLRAERYADVNFSGRTKLFTSSVSQSAKLGTSDLVFELRSARVSENREEEMLIRAATMESKGLVKSPSVSNDLIEKVENITETILSWHVQRRVFYSIIWARSFHLSLNAPELNNTSTYNQNGKEFMCGFGFRYQFNKHFSIRSGVAYSKNTYTFKQSVMPVFQDGISHLALDSPAGISTNVKSLLSASYLTVPLIFKWYPRGGSLQVSAGAMGSLLISSHYFRSYSTIGISRDIEETWEYKNFAPLQGSAYLSAGIWGVTCFAKYTFTPLFKDRREIVAYPYSFGISIGL